MILQLEERLKDLRGYLDELAPKTATQSDNLDYLLMQTYILGFQEASKLAIKHIDKQGSLT
jgi:hypothetical protein